MNKDQFWLLLSRHLAGEASKDEEQQLQEYINASEDLKSRYDLILKHWGESIQQSEIDAEVAYQKIRPKMNAPAKEPGKLRFFLRAAAFLFVALGIGWFSNTFQENIEWVEKQNAKGVLSKIVLPDGSSIWLNGDSKLRYPATFSDKAREVSLEGEAFFDVTKDPARPFVIHLSEGEIRVLGTSFNVKAFEDDPVVETSVVSGKVAFISMMDQSDRHADTVLLVSNQKAVYSRIAHKTSVLASKNDEAKAWTENKLIFRSERLDEVGKVLERTYGKTIEFESEDLKHCRITGTFFQNTVEEIMTILAETKDYRFTISNDKIILSGTGCAGDGEEDLNTNPN